MKNGPLSLPMKPIDPHLKAAHPAIFQNRIPFDLSPRALPGVRPLGQDDWTLVDEAYADQIAYRSHLLDTKRDVVCALRGDAFPAASELLDHALDLFHRIPGHGFTIEGDWVRRPDGERIHLDRLDPLGTLGVLLQEDLCILEKQGDEHMLTGAVLCFPANWSLSEKFLRPLTRIHTPIPEYDAQIAKRVQRLFDGVQTGRPLWRFNCLWYADPELHQPQREQDPERPMPSEHGPRFCRSEKQAIFRLPKTNAVVFSIHTFVLQNGVIPAGGSFQ